jgi:hypothetical protein
VPSFLTAAEHRREHHSLAFGERSDRQPRWLRSSSATIIVSVSRELRRIASGGRDLTCT